MNWIGGSKNRFRGVHDDQKKQKEFFERRRLANRVKSATSLTTPVGKKKSISRDILHLQCVKQTKRSPFKGEEVRATNLSPKQHKSYKIQRTVNRVDFTRGRNMFDTCKNKLHGPSYRRNFKEKIHLPNASPYKQPSNIELADATDDEHIQPRYKQFKHLPSYQSTPIDQPGEQQRRNSSIETRYQHCGFPSFSRHRPGHVATMKNVSSPRESISDRLNRSFDENNSFHEESSICDRSRAEKKVNFSHINEYYSLSSDSENRSDPHSCFDMSFLLCAGTSPGPKAHYPSPASFDMIESVSVPQLDDDATAKPFPCPSELLNDVMPTTSRSYDELHNNKGTGSIDYELQDFNMFLPSFDGESRKIDLETSFGTQHETSRPDLASSGNSPVFFVKKDPNDMLVNKIGIDDTPILRKKPLWRLESKGHNIEETELPGFSFLNKSISRSLHTSSDSDERHVPRASENLRKWLEVKSASNSLKTTREASLTQKFETGYRNFVNSDIEEIRQNSQQKEDLFLQVGKNSIGENLLDRTLTETPKLIGHSNSNRQRRVCCEERILNQKTNKKGAAAQQEIYLCDLYEVKQPVSCGDCRSSNTKHGSGEAISQNEIIHIIDNEDPCTRADDILPNKPSNDDIFHCHSSNNGVALQGNKSFPWIINENDGLAFVSDVKELSEDENSVSLVKILTGSKTPVMNSVITEKEEKNRENLKCPTTNDNITDMDDRRSYYEQKEGIIDSGKQTSTATDRDFLPNVADQQDAPKQETFINEQRIEDEVTMVLYQTVEKLNESLKRTSEGTTTEKTTLSDSDSNTDRKPSLAAIGNNEIVQTLGGGQRVYANEATFPTTFGVKPTRTISTQTDEDVKLKEPVVTCVDNWAQTERFSPAKTGFNLSNFYPRVELGVDVRNSVALNHGSVIVKRQKDLSTSQSSDDSLFRGNASTPRKSRSIRKKRKM